MRGLVDRPRLVRFMEQLGRAARSDTRIYLAGGASAVLLDWRTATIDVDLEIRPERDELLRAIPALKETLDIIVELASPGHFPELPAWEERSPFIARHGRASFHHYDFYAQALSKIERSHARDREDVAAMHRLRLISADRLMELFAAIEPQLYRYPAIDPATFRKAVEGVAEELRP